MQNCVIRGQTVKEGAVPCLQLGEDSTLDRHGKATFSRRFIINFEQENIQAGISRQPSSKVGF